MHLTGVIGFASAIVFVAGSGSPNVEFDDCVESNEPTICYHCDSHVDPNCGDPFKYSHYYISKQPYLVECQGCCIKMLDPKANGTGIRIRRSCTEKLPSVNFTLKSNCQKAKNEREICLCKEGLCNSQSINVPNVIVIALSLLPLVYNDLQQPV